MGIGRWDEAVGKGCVDDEITVVGDAGAGFRGAAETEGGGDGAESGETGEDVGGRGGDNFDRDAGVVSGERG